ncbi:MAG: ABC transporter substrate-binding protein [Planctomycetes bacterium]|nr:ABC transporter substrate-binding protein [Planctomycetota bacterium]
MQLAPALALCPWLLAAAAPLPAQSAPATPRIGVFLWHDSPNDATTLAGLRRGFEIAATTATWIERRASADPVRAEQGLAELQAAGCDLVVALGTQSALLAKASLRGVPVLFAAVSDPVASGLVGDWSGSGTLLCGASNWIEPAAVLAVFRIAVPDLQRLGIVRSAASGIVSAAELARMRAHLAATPAAGITLLEAVAADAGAVDRAPADLVARGVDAVWVPIDLTVYSDIAAVRRGLGSRRVPILSTAATGVGSGAHVGAAVDYDLHGRRAAVLALRVLRGDDPGRLPVDRMHGTLIRVDLATARADGIELPLSVLAIADELLDEEAPRAGR